METSSVDLLVMDGLVLHELPHQTDPGLESQRINLTFKWIKHHACSCPRASAVACCLPLCAHGFSVQQTPGGQYVRFSWVFLILVSFSWHWEICGLLGPLLCEKVAGVLRKTCGWSRVEVIPCSYSLHLNSFYRIHLYQHYKSRWNIYPGKGKGLSFSR